MIQFPSFTRKTLLQHSPPEEEFYTESFSNKYVKNDTGNGNPIHVIKSRQMKKEKSL